MDILQYFIKIIYFTIFCASPFKNMQNSTFTLILTIYVQIPCTGTSCLAMLTSGIRELWAGGGGHCREKITLGLDSTFLGRSFLKGQYHEILLTNFFNNYTNHNPSSKQDLMRFLGRSFLKGQHHEIL